MASIERTTYQDPKSPGSRYIVTKVRWVLKNAAGRQIDAPFTTKAAAERALRLLPKADR